MVRKYVLALLLSVLCTGVLKAQAISTIDGKCNGNVMWAFDGRTLFITKISNQAAFVEIPDYDVKNNPSPWMKRGLPIQKVVIGSGICRIGSCAFANCRTLEAVEFENDKQVSSIGWGAFLNCENLFTFSIPVTISKIEKIAFANNYSLRSVKISGQTRVEDYAFMSCKNLNVIEIAKNVLLGKMVFAAEGKDGQSGNYSYFDGYVSSLPPNITTDNCEEYGISKSAVAAYLEKQKPLAESDEIMSHVDSDIPECFVTRSNTYALIIGNEDYRFVANAPFAAHDATVFAEYCKLTLGVPAQNIHLCLNATKYMILESEMEEWLKGEVKERGLKNLIVYYAGHGVPDVNDRNKAYLLPVDVFGTKPRHGIALDDFYKMIGDLGFKQVTVFLDACFSGVNRDNESLNDGLRGVEIEVEDCKPTGNMVVFSASQGNETAQGYHQQGHGLFTYFLLKELQDSYGQVSFENLSKNLQKDVQTTAPQLKLRKQQTPTVNVSESMTNIWKEQTL